MTCEHVFEVKKEPINMGDGSVGILETRICIMCDYEVKEVLE